VEDWQRERDQMERDYLRQEAVDGCINVIVGGLWIVMLFVIVWAESR
jgi:hypothetical protein